MLYRVIRTLIVLAGIMTLALPSGASDPLPPLKVGVIFSYSGSTATTGRTLDAAIAAWVKLHGDTVAGRKIVIIKRDDGGIGPETAKRVAQELIVQDGVDILAGATFTPNAIAIASVSTQAKKPFFVVNAATSGILAKHPYAARFGFTTNQQVEPIAQWAARQGYKSAYLLYQDYGPGLDAGRAFTQAFSAGGGKVIGEVRVPLSNADFTAYVQRAKDAKPDLLYVWLNPGGGVAAALKAVREAGLDKLGIKVLAAGDVVAENALPAIGDSADGLITSMDYSAWHDSKLNREFVKAFTSVEPSLLPDFNAVAAFDVMNAIYRIVAAQNGAIDPDKTMELVRGLSFESPRGPLAIDPQTRDAVENIYLRRTERKHGAYVNTEIATFPAVRDTFEMPK
jgi:branched-chain amino acid transport system substrate-binding protein